MIITIKSHPTNAEVALAAVPYELADEMGLFGPARWDAERKAYLVDFDEVDRFARFLRFRGHRLVDDRKAARTAPGTWTPEPLPECTSCGRPASRATSARLEVCPACKAPWVPMVFREGRVVRTREEQAAINERGMAKVRQAIIDAKPDLDPVAMEAALQGHCGWCAANAGQVCHNDYGIAIKGVHAIRVPVLEEVVPPW